MKYSIIIPCYDPDKKKRDVMQACFQSIAVHSYKESYELIKVWNVDGFPKAVNKGIKQANGDFLIVMNDDVLIRDDNWLDKLAQPSRISSWRLHRFFMTGEDVPDGSLFCLPRSVYNRIGLFDEQFADGYGFSDSDYWFRATAENVPFHDAGVDILHAESKTFLTYYEDEKDDMFEKNKNLFEHKYDL